MNEKSAVLPWFSDNPKAFAIVPLNLLEQYPEYIRANTISGVTPDLVSISAGKYPLVRPIYLYIKHRQIEAIPGLQEFLYEFTSERSIGQEGCLVGTGFGYLDDQGRNRARDFALSLDQIKQ